MANEERKTGHAYPHFVGPHAEIAHRMWNIYNQRSRLLVAIDEAAKKVLPQGNIASSQTETPLPTSQSPDQT